MPIPAHAANRRLTRQGLRLSLAGDPLLADKTDVELDSALSAVNQDALYDEIRSQITVTVWDRTSPINSIPAQHFLDRDDVGDTGDIYLLYRNGTLFGFQPHDPELPGVVPIPKGQGKTRGERQADIVAADNAASEALRLFRENLTA